MDGVGIIVDRVQHAMPARKRPAMANERPDTACPCVARTKPRAASKPPANGKKMTANWPPVRLAAKGSMRVIGVRDKYGV